MGNKTGRQKSQEQGEGEDFMNKQEDDSLNIAGDQAAENLEASSKTAEEQSKEDDKETKKEEDNSRPTENKPKEEEQVSEEEPKNLVEQKESELNEQVTSRGDTSANETKSDLTETKQIDSFETNEQNKIVSSKIYQETSEEIKASSEQKERSDCTAEGSKDEFLKTEDPLTIPFEQMKVDDAHLESAVQEEKQVAQSIKKSEAVPQQEEKISNEILSEKASSETKKQPESCVEIIKDIEACEEHAKASGQVQSKGDQLDQSAVLEQVQVAESTKKYEGVLHQEKNVSKDISAQDVSSEQEVQQESCRDVNSKDEVLKVGGRRSETPEQVNVEDDQSELEVHEQEQLTESINQDTIVHQQEDSILKDNTTHDAFSEQKERFESFGEVSKDEVLKADERRTEIPEQANFEDDELNPKFQNQEHVDESTEKSKTVPTLEEVVSNESSEEKEHVESFADEYLKADKRRAETPEQVNIEDYKREPDVHEQEQDAKTVKKSETMLHEEENVFNEISAHETSSVQPESIGEVSKDKVLKSVEVHVEPLQQIKSEDNQPEPEVRKEEKLAEIMESEYVRQKEENDSKEILAKEETTREQETHAMVANTSFKEAGLQCEKAEEASSEKAEIKKDEADGKQEGEYAEQVRLEGIADIAREQPILVGDDGIENNAAVVKYDSLD